MSSSQEPYTLDSLSGDTLLTRLKELVGRSNQLTAHLLAHLAEVDARGIHRDHACSSIYVYCTYELRMSEDEAQRRVLAARTARRFPTIFSMLEHSAIHLTGILLLTPHLTKDNHEDLLARARFRSKREIQKLVGNACPRPDAPAIIEPLGPQQQFSTRAPTWAPFVESLAGPVRDIPPGNGPGQAPVAPPPLEGVYGVEGDPLEADFGAPLASEEFAPPPSESTALARHDDEPSQRYRIQFTAEQRYVDLLEEARNLLQHQIRDRNIADVHLRAMEALVEKLRKQRCRATDRPRTRKEAPASAEEEAQASDAPARHDAPAADAPARKKALAPKRSRHIPAAVVRDVWARDGGQCTFVDERGVRCRERAGLEIQHREPHARGGPATTENCTLHCKSHNQFAAERDFGEGFILARIDEARSRGSTPSKGPAQP